MKVSTTIEVYDINIMDIIEIVYKKLKNNEKEGRDIFDHPYFGKVSYKLIENEKSIQIAFSGIKDKISIFENKVLFKFEGKEIASAHDMNSLQAVLTKCLDEYDFYVENIIKTQNQILEHIPPEIILKKKEHRIPFEIFQSINIKHEIPINEKIISIQTNELVTQDINSLGIKRNEQFKMVIEKRNELIKEIEDFMDSQEKIMKIFGCDGIGKSISFIYLTSLKNNFKTVYFNLKEFHNAEISKKKEIFKYQLMNYYTNTINYNSEETKARIIKNNYDNFSKVIENIENNYKQDFNFWDLFQIFLGIITSLKKTLFIFDQYKIENDKSNELEKIEKTILKAYNIKLLVASSLNDMRVKNEFINILKLYLKIWSNEENQKKNEKKEDKIEKEEEDIFDQYKENNNYIDNEEEDDNFNNIKKFNDNGKEQNDDNKTENLNQKNEIKEINNISLPNYINSDYINLDNYNKNYRIIYINNLIKVNNIKNKNDKEENKIIGKLANFGYNPKYYNKFKNFYYKNIKIDKNKSINSLYADFLYNIYEKIMTKIEIFYQNYNDFHSINTVFSNLIFKKLINLDRIIKEGTILNLKLLIFYLEEFPVKYIKIFQVKENGKKEIKNFLNFNQDLIKKNFKLEYVFPFMKFIIGRLIYEYGKNNISEYNNFSASGSGSLLEKEIRKAITIENIFGKFYLRNFWSFEGFSSKKKARKRIIEGNVNKKKDEKGKKQAIKEETKEEDENNQEEEGTQEEEEEIQEEEEKEPKEEEEEENNEEEGKKEKEKSKEIDYKKKAKQNKKECKNKIKIDFFNFTEVKYDDFLKNTLDEYNAYYYIIPHKDNNKYLDSIILIPVKEKSFKLISLQITINKEMIYTLEEYHNATNVAAKLIEDTYGISIIDKYFLFVLDIDYKNSTTQTNLINNGIPFIFFSNYDNCFLYSKNNRIINVEQLINDKYLIQSNKEIKKVESIFYKNMKFLKMSYLLNKKKKREKIKITQNLFHYIRKKIFKNETALVLPKEVKIKIIKKINSNKYYQGKKITIEYVFRANFLRINELYNYYCKDLLGIVFYKGEIFLINNQLEEKITMFNNVSNKNDDKLFSIFKYINKNCDNIMDIDENIDNLSFSSTTKPNYKELITYNLNRPSDIFIFAIYEIN